MRREAAVASVHCEVLEGRLHLDAVPTAALTPVTDINSSITTVDLVVTYSDDVGINPATLGAGDRSSGTYPDSPADITVTGPNGFSAVAVYVEPSSRPALAPSVTATYRVTAPNGRFSSADNGTYTIHMNGSAVQDGTPNSVAASTLGTFDVTVPTTVAGGNITTGFATDLAIQSVAVQSDGKILVAGSESYSHLGDDTRGQDPTGIVTEQRYVLRRFNADGSVDTSFGAGDGRAELAANGNSMAFAVLARPDGKIYVAGGSAAVDLNFTLTRFNANGTLDSGFGNGGEVIIAFDRDGIGNDLGIEDIAHAISFQSDGKIILAGHTTAIQGGAPTLDLDFAVMRLNTDGTLDNTFGGSGTGRISFDLSTAHRDSAGTLLVLSDDKILVAGAAGSNVAVTRLNANGTMDTSFNTVGSRLLTLLTTASIAASLDDFHVGLAIQGTKVLVAASNSTGLDFAVARLNADGTTDSSFGTAGIATVDFGGTDQATRVVVLASGKLLVLGDTLNAGTLTTAIAALNADGTPYTAYETNGKTTLDSVTASSAAPTVASAIDASGNIIVTRINSAGTSQVRKLAGDIVAPLAALTTIPDITGAGGTSLTFTVTYTDDAAIDAADITNNPTAVSITGPTGAIPVSLVSVDASTNGPVRIATYSITPPGGAWDVSDNGVYTVAIAGTTISDAGNVNFVASGSLGSFAVNITPGAPTGQLAAVASITTAGGSGQSFNVTYTSNTPIDITTLGTADLVVGRDGGPTLTVATATVNGSGTSVTVTYVVAAPGATWDADDNGTYVIQLAASQVKNTSGLFATAAVLGSFDVDVPASGENGTALGDFGVVTGKKKSLTFTDSGKRITLALAGGTGHATMRDGKLELVLDGTTAKSTVSIKAKGGTGRVTLGDVSASGGLKSFSAPTGDLAGDFSTSGAGKFVVGNLSGTVTTAGSLSSLDVRGNLSGRLNVGGALSKLTVRGIASGAIRVGGLFSSAAIKGNLSGTIGVGGALSKLSVSGDFTGTVSAVGGISSLAVTRSVTGGRVLAGANLGDDGQVGGSGADADTFASGTIGKIAVNGTITGGLFAAGLNPVNGILLDGDDVVIGVADSVIASISSKGAVDPTTRFVAGAFGRIKLPGGAVDLTTDGRFKIL